MNAKMIEYNFAKKNGIYIVSKYLLTKYLIIMKGKRKYSDFIVDKTLQITFNHMIKLISHAFYMMP